MTNEYFIGQNETVAKFIQLYCDGAHKNATKEDGILNLNYNGNNLDKKIDYHLCQECKDMLLYANQRLSNCPHDPKPKCRQCKQTCYEKTQWKQMVKIMRSSGMKLGLTKIKTLFIGNN